MRKLHLYILIILSVILTLSSCSATKFVPDGAYLLDDVKITTDNKDVKPSTLRPYVRQNPNSKWFNLFKTQLSVYSLSGRDSTKWINKFLRKIGDEPIIFDETEALRTQAELTKAVQNMGYMGATVKQTVKTKKKKLKLNYEVNTGNPYIINTIKYDIQDALIAQYLNNDSLNTLLKDGMLFDVNVLDQGRQRVANYLLRNGYYKFNKEFITYTADTIRGSDQIDLTLHLLPYRSHTGDEPHDHPQYTINKINFITEYDVLQSSALSSIEINDSVHYKNIPIYYKDKL